MKQFIVIVTFMSAVIVTMAQRAPFAGKRPNGYKDRLQTDSPDNNGIGDRFGENTNTGPSSTTERLPHLALGDRDIVDRLNTFPIDQRPFWLINAEAIEAQKNQGRPASNTNQNSATVVNRFGTSGTTNNAVIPNYPSVVYPVEMTADQRQQAQQNFHSQIQQNTNTQQPIISNPLPSRIGVVRPAVTPAVTPVATQQTINSGASQIPLSVQGRIPTNSGYYG